jgi:hypothetical protein
MLEMQALRQMHGTTMIAEGLLERTRVREGKLFAKPFRQCADGMMALAILPLVDTANLQK